MTDNTNEEKCKQCQRCHAEIRGLCVECFIRLSYED